MADLQHVRANLPRRQRLLGIAFDVAGQQRRPAADDDAQHDRAVVLRRMFERVIGDECANRHAADVANVAIAHEVNRNRAARAGFEHALRAIAAETARRNPDAADVDVFEHGRQSAAVIGMHVRQDGDVDVAHAAIDQHRQQLLLAEMCVAEAAAGVDEDDVMRRTEEERVALADVEHRQPGVRHVRVAGDHRGDERDQHRGEDHQRADAAGQKRDRQHRHRVTRRAHDVEVVREVGRRALRGGADSAQAPMISSTLGWMRSRGASLIISVTRSNRRSRDAAVRSSGPASARAIARRGGTRAPSATSDAGRPTPTTSSAGARSSPPASARSSACGAWTSAVTAPRRRMHSCGGAALGERPGELLERPVEAVLGAWPRCARRRMTSTIAGGHGEVDAERRGARGDRPAVAWRVRLEHLVEQRGAHRPLLLAGDAADAAQRREHRGGRARRLAREPRRGRPAPARHREPAGRRAAGRHRRGQDVRSRRPRTPRPSPAARSPRARCRRPAPRPSTRRQRRRRRTAARSRRGTSTGARRPPAADRPRRARPSGRAASTRRAAACAGRCSAARG